MAASHRRGLSRRGFGSQGAADAAASAEGRTLAARGNDERYVLASARENFESRARPLYEDHYTHYGDSRALPGAAVSDMDLSQAYTENSHGSHQSGPQRAYGAGPSSPKAAQSWDALQHNGALSPPLPGHGHALRSGDAGKPGIAYVSGAGRPPTTISMDDSEWASQYRQPHAVTSPTRPVPSRAGASGLRAAPSVLTRHTLRGVAGPPAHGVRRLWAWVPASIPIRLFLLVTLLESGVDIAIEVVLLSRFRTQEGGILGSNFEGVQPALPVFVMVFCLAHVYQCALAVDAVINRNTILIFGLVIFNIAL